MRIDTINKIPIPTNTAAIDGKTEMVSDHGLNAPNMPVKQDAISKDFIEKAVRKANYAMKIQNRCLEFRIHEKTNDIMVKIIDSDTKEVIREIPPEKLLDMFANMLELAGLLVDEKR